MSHALLKSTLFLLLVITSIRGEPLQAQKGVAWDDLVFSGYDWQAKRTLKGRKGPGPNLYSYGKENVWVDEEGRLHLRISNRRNRWWCSEVALKQSLGYGTYLFHLEKLPEELDRQVVLGMFTWDDQPLEYHREIDVEISNWGGATRENTQFVVQPHGKPGNKQRVHSRPAQSSLTYGFEWSPTKIEFLILQRPSTESNTENILERWSYHGAGVPSIGAAVPRIALWLYKGHPPTDGREVEVVIKGFEFKPLDH